MANSAKRTSRPVSESSGTRRPVKKKLPIGLIIVGGGAVVTLLLVVLLVMADRPRPVNVEQYDNLPASWVSGRSLGNPDAPVVISTYEDFLCPACASWSTQVKDQLMNDFVRDGIVRLEYNYFPLSSFEPGASNAAQAAQCAADQGAFWPYHDRLFSVTNSGQPAFTPARLETYAGELGLNQRQFSQCLNGQVHFNTVQSSLSQAVSLGLTSTPSVFLNGQQLASPFDYPTMTSLIRQIAGQ